ncbi:DUF397 domain-containing protein [Streptomyces mayteni]
MRPTEPPSWQKSSFSSEGNNCLEVAAAPRGGAVLLRESDEPDTVLRATPARLRALLATVRRA